MTHQFDSQSFVRRMEAAGMARGIAEDGLVTRRDLSEGFERADNRLRESIKDLELRVTLRFEAMLAGSTALSIAILGALIALK